mmetsp:Transcript_109676/g.353812  ORF Transcript_109676/g.353812 Transcript_109676/m.353812 type:complete len:85 (+) Transcript_109676:1068-1322(+)
MESMELLLDIFRPALIDCTDDLDVDRLTDAPHHIVNLSQMRCQPLRQLRARTLGIVSACLDVCSSAIASQKQKARVCGQDCFFG